MAASQNRTVLSPPAEARVRPSGPNATAATGAVCPLRVEGLPSGGNIPEPDDLLCIGTEWSPTEARARPSGTECHMLDGGRMPAKGAPLLPCGDVPEPDGVSSLAEAILRPSGLKATPLTSRVWPRKIMASWSVDASQSLTVPSQLAEARVRPSGLNATPEAAAVCPRRVRISSPVAASHSFTVWSILAEASLARRG